MSDYGNGLFLDQHFDLSVGADGDLAVARDASELRKDIAFRVAAALDDGTGLTAPPSVTNGVIGSVMTRGFRSDVENALGVLVEADPRIDTVVRVAIESGPRNQTVTADLRVIAFDTPLDVSVTAGESS